MYMFKFLHKYCKELRRLKTVGRFSLMFHKDNFCGFQFSSAKGSPLKGKNLLPRGANPRGANSFLLEQTPLLEGRQNSLSRKCIEVPLRSPKTLGKYGTN